eukprot:CAMPEP_0114228486 /NCGR_PEP_ID=MMETSP0058-20121206/2373_1 /TAXON_ID=36894 /ORGANISM="Pyramimonas parkeae, CCMP726" /LENGTH=132 /DNA_ID=CAMNT_0001339445 /DNA_START=32 /DNA_END=432 /DNA_ORIENTATION=-
MDVSRLAVPALASFADKHPTEMVEAGAVPTLLSLLRAGNEDVQLVVTRALVLISNHEMHRVRLINDGAVPLLISLSRADNPDLHQLASDALTNIAEAGGPLAVMLNPIMLDLKGRIRASCRTGGLLVFAGGQ